MSNRGPVHRTVILERPAAATTARVVIRHTPGTGRPELARVNGSHRGPQERGNPVLVAGPHPRYRLPLNDMLRTLEGADGRDAAAIAISQMKAAGAAVLPVIVQEYVESGIDIRIAAEGETMPAGGPTAAVVVPGAHGGVTDALRTDVERQLDELSAWLNGATWRIEVDEEHRCPRCKTTSWRRVAAADNVHDTDLRKCGRTAAEIGGRIAADAGYRIVDPTRYWSDAKTWWLNERMEPPTVSLAENADGSRRVRVLRLESPPKPTERKNGATVVAFADTNTLTTDGLRPFIAEKIRELAAAGCEHVFAIRNPEDDGRGIHRQSGETIGEQSMVSWSEPDGGDEYVVGVAGTPKVSDRAAAYEAARTAVDERRRRYRCWRRGDSWQAKLEIAETCPACGRPGWKAIKDGRAIHAEDFPGNLEAILKEVRQSRSKGWTLTFDPATLASTARRQTPFREVADETPA